MSFRRHAQSVRLSDVFTIKSLRRGLFSLVCLHPLVGWAADWPQHLGPHRNGISDETGLIDKFPADGPKILWRVPGGVGMSGIAVVGEMAVTLVQDEEHQKVLALNAGTGKQMWSTDVALAFKNAMGDGPRGMPAISGGLVFVYTGEGILAALDAKSGEIRWKHDVVTELGGKSAEYGMACSPLVVDKQVIVTAGTDKATLVAFDKATGKQVWTAGKKSPAGYSSPTLLSLGGIPQIVAFVGTGVIGVTPQNGAQLWSYPYPTDFNCNTATPLAIDGKLFLSSAENHGSVLLNVPETAGGEVTEAWTSQGPKSVLRNEWQTSLHLGDHLYGFDNVGSAGPITHLTCIAAKTGKRAWQALRFGKGNFMAADGKLWCTTMAGELVIVKATPQEFQELSRATVLNETRQAPSLSNGRLFVRDSEEIVCVDVKAK